MNISCQKLIKVENFVHILQNKICPNYSRIKGVNGKTLKSWKQLKQKPGKNVDERNIFLQIVNVFARRKRSSPHRPFVCDNIGNAISPASVFPNNFHGLQKSWEQLSSLPRAFANSSSAINTHTGVSIRIQLRKVD